MFLLYGDAYFLSYCDRMQLKQINKDNNNNERNNKLDFLFVDYMSCAMLLFVRDQLMGGEYQHCLRQIMKYPPIENISQLVAQAYVICDRIENKSRKPVQLNKLMQYILTCV